MIGWQTVWKYLMLVITPWNCLAITNKQPAQYEYTENVRNFRHIPGPSSESAVDWQVGLKEAVLQSLLRERYRDDDLRERLRAAPLLGRRDASPSFGDVVVLARGQLYAKHSGNLALVQDEYRNECDDCYNPRRCDKHQCQAWTPQNQEQLLALWTVKRLRHRDFHGKSRYEIEYTVSPLNDATRNIIIRKGRFNYAIPGHVFVIKPGESDKNTANKHDQEIYNRKIPHHHYLPTIPIGYDSTGHQNVLHSYPGFFTSNAAIPPHQNVPTTNDSKEIELYKKLIEALASKTSTTKVPLNHHEGVTMPHGISMKNLTTQAMVPTSTKVPETKPTVIVRHNITNPESTKGTIQTAPITLATTASSKPTKKYHITSKKPVYTLPKTDKSTLMTKPTKPTIATTTSKGTTISPKPQTIAAHIISTTTTSTPVPQTIESHITSPTTTTTTPVPQTIASHITSFTTTTNTPKPQTIASHIISSTSATTTTTTSTLKPQTMPSHMIPSTSATTTTNTSTLKPQTIASHMISSSSATTTTTTTTTSTQEPEATSSHFTSSSTTTSTLQPQTISSHMTTTTMKIPKSTLPTIINMTATQRTTTQSITTEASISKLTTQQTIPTISSKITTKPRTTTMSTVAPSSSKPSETKPPTMKHTEPSTNKISSSSTTRPTTITTTIGSSTLVISDTGSTTSTVVPKNHETTIPVSPMSVASTMSETTSEISQSQSSASNEMVDVTETTTSIHEAPQTESSTLQSEEETQPTDQMPAPSIESQTTPFTETLSTTQETTEPVTQYTTTEGSNERTSMKQQESTVTSDKPETTSTKGESNENMTTEATSHVPKTTSTMRTTTASDFLTEAEPIKEPINTKPVKEDFDLDDIFGSTIATMKPASTTTIKVTESDLAVQLFGNKDLHNAKVIFANFYEASTTAMLTKYDDMTVESEPLTSQSYETSISYQVNKRRTKEYDSTLKTPRRLKARRYKNKISKHPRSSAESSYLDTTTYSIQLGTLNPSLSTTETNYLAPESTLKPSSKSKSKSIGHEILQYSDHTAEPSSADKTFKATESNNFNSKTSLKNLSSSKPSGPEVIVEYPGYTTEDNNVKIIESKYSATKNTSKMSSSWKPSNHNMVIEDFSSYTTESASADQNSRTTESIYSATETTSKIPRSWMTSEHELIVKHPVYTTEDSNAGTIESKNLATATSLRIPSSWKPSRPKVPGTAKVSRYTTESLSADQNIRTTESKYFPSKNSLKPLSNLKPMDHEEIVEHPDFTTENNNVSTIATKYLTTEANMNMLSSYTTESASADKNVGSTIKAFDDLAMRLVNHARGLDYLSKRNSRPTKPRYKKRRTYTPRYRKTTRKKIRSR